MTGVTGKILVLSTGLQRPNGVLPRVQYTENNATWLKTILFHFYFLEPLFSMFVSDCSLVKVTGIKKKSTSPIFVTMNSNATDKANNFSLILCLKIFQRNFCFEFRPARASLERPQTAVACNVTVRVPKSAARWSQCASECNFALHMFTLNFIE